MIGRTLSHYTITERLGAGGMGVVYRAVDARLDRAVALKVLANDAVADPDRKRRFVTEARAASALNHPNIVTIHDIDQADGVAFLVMELVAGKSLRQLIPPDGLPVDRAIDYALQIAAALTAAHAAGIVHRDIKPANVMATDAGAIKVLDFGVSKLLDRAADSDAATEAVTNATDTGMILGTLRYMSPEQALGQPVDTRSDIFSFGAVLYEMLAGRAAFAGDTGATSLAAVLTQSPPPLESVRRDVPADLASLINACLAKDRVGRPAAQELVRRLTAIRDARATPPPVSLGRALRRPAVLVPSVLLLLAAIAGGGWWWKTTARAQWARTVALPEIQRLVSVDDYDAAYRLATEALAVLPDDPQLKQLLFNITFLTTIDSVPTGADVSVRGYVANDREWIPLGRTPLENTRVPFGQVRLRIAKDGFAPIETTLGGLKYTYTLDPPASIPAGMVRVQAADPRVLGTSVHVSDFWLDKFEVTNREFKAFVDRGGYRTREFWTEPFVSHGKTLSWDEAMAVFRDTTGKPGPSTWELGSFPEDQADMPVTGVSWYEAAAYAVFAGKSLPTAYHWRAAAAFGTFAGNFSEIMNVSNFAAKGPVRVGTLPGLGPSGTYDMAGNAKEWCWNESGEKRFILGGGWNELSYAFTDMDAQPPFDRGPIYGFRLAKYIDAPPAAASNTIVLSSRDYTKEKPVDAAIFEVYRGLYQYDATAPLNHVVEATEELPSWRKETITFDAAYGRERVRAYLYLPKTSSPPYQTVVFFPGGDAMFLKSSRELRMQSIDFLMQSGRALLYPVYKGTYERPRDPGSGPLAVRDLVIQRSKDLGRSLDYLATRPDVDATRLAYYGISAGAYSGVIFTALEPRFKASVILGGGLETFPFPPEVDVWNFAPRVRVPTLMVNAKADFGYPIETSQRPLFDAIGTTDKKHVHFEGGHIPVRIHDMMKAILGWLDGHMGPVKQ